MKKEKRSRSRSRLNTNQHRAWPFTSSCRSRSRKKSKKEKKSDKEREEESRLILNSYISRSQYISPYSSRGESRGESKENRDKSDGPAKVTVISGVRGVSVGRLGFLKYNIKRPLSRSKRSPRNEKNIFVQ